MDKCYYYAWNIFLVFSTFSGEILPDKKGGSTSNLEDDESQNIYFHPHNSAANFTESVFVIDNYSGSPFEWQTK